jgi:hypothetical protein
MFIGRASSVEYADQAACPDNWLILEFFLQRWRNRWSLSKRRFLVIRWEKENLGTTDKLCPAKVRDLE